MHVSYRWLTDGTASPQAGVLNLLKMCLYAVINHMDAKFPGTQLHLVSLKRLPNPFHRCHYSAKLAAPPRAFQAVTGLLASLVINTWLQARFGH